MNPRVRSVAFALVATAMGLGGWVATLWVASERWAGVACSAIGVLLIAAAFRGRFAVGERARDFWTGFALFGLVHFVADRPKWSHELMTSSAIERIGDLVLGADNPDGGGRANLTPLGLSIALVPVERGGGSLWTYLPYVRQTTRLFAGLAFAAIGGVAACHIRRGSVLAAPIPGLGGCPPLGIAWLALLGGVIGATFAIHAHPELTFDGGPFPKCPGSEAADFMLYNVEFLAVLFAALEARFAVEVERAWWVGFALFGGAYLLAGESPLAAILPTRGTGDLFQWVYHRSVSESQSPSVAVRGLILMDRETSMFFQTGLAWAGLAAFLPFAWLGTLAGRLARKLGAASSRPRSLDRWRIRSRLGRNMLALVALGLFLAVVKHPSEGHVAALGNAIAGLLLFAALRASSGPESSRAWWWGFALVGGIDFLVGAKRDNGVFDPEWPIHAAFSGLYRPFFERYIGQALPNFPLFDDDEFVAAANYAAFIGSRRLVLMALCLPMGWAGATLASWLDRRCRRRPIGNPGEFSQGRGLAGEYPPVHQ